MMLHRAVILSLSLALAALLGACASGLPEPTLDHNPDYDFGQIKTYAFAHRRGGPADFTVLSDMEVDRVNHAFERAMTQRGYQRVDRRADADILLSWELLTRDRTDVRSYNATSYYSCWGCGPAVSDVRVRQYTQGTLIVDMIDPDERKSVWRSVVQSKLNDRQEVEGQQERFNAVAEHMLTGFPP